jgi:sporulation protein YlmC with PRC-barrel domain
MTSIENAAQGLISSSKVEGTAVYNVEGEKLGSVDCLMIDKQSGHVAYAVMSFGGFLGLGEKRHPVPWQSMSYDKSKDGYVVGLSREQLEAAPNLNPGEYGQLGDRAYEETVYTHYKAEPYWL